MLVHALGKGFGQTVGERLQHDVRIIVDMRLELGELGTDAMAGGDRKAASFHGAPTEGVMQLVHAGGLVALVEAQRGIPELRTLRVFLEGSEG